MPPGTNMYDPTVPGHIPFPAFAPNSTYQATGSISSYNSFQAVYQHQLTAGLTLLANYTYSKCFTDQRSLITASSLGEHTGSQSALAPGFGQAGDYGLLHY